MAATTVDLDPWEALTTIFTPPADCSRGPCASATLLTGALTCTGPASEILSCYSAALTSHSNMVPPPNTWFSPGVCPFQYYVSPADQSNTVVYPVTQSESTGSSISSSTSFEIFPQSYCCPSGMIVVSATCVSEVLAPTSIYVGSTIRAISSPFVVHVYPLQIQWQASDLPYFTPINAPLISSLNNTTMPIYGTVAALASTMVEPSIASSTPSSASSPRYNKSPLSIHVKIGIGVGVAFGALALFMFLSAIFWRRRQRQFRRLNRGGGWIKPELSGEGVKRPTTELDFDRQVHEADGRGVVTELDAAPRYELEGGWLGNELLVDSRWEKR